VEVGRREISPFGEGRSGNACRWRHIQVSSHGWGSRNRGGGGNACRWRHLQVSSHGWGSRRGQGKVERTLRSWPESRGKLLLSISGGGKGKA
jgi:hypothetical protein